MLAFLLSPIGRYIAIGLLIAAAVGAYTLKVRHDAREALLVQIEKEKTDAIEKANAARDRLRAVCNAAPDNCVPDDWFRD